MKVTYDPAVDMAHISLREVESGGIANNIHVDAEEGVSAGDLILEFDPEGRLVGIEVFGAFRTLPAEILDEARQRL